MAIALFPMYVTIFLFLLLHLDPLILEVSTRKQGGSGGWLLQG